MVQTLGHRSREMARSVPRLLASSLLLKSMCGCHLGYGATTLPGLTEALTVDKNAMAAMVESERLVDLIDKLAAAIRR